MKVAASHDSRVAQEKEDGEGDRCRDRARGLDGEAAELRSVAKGQVQGGDGARGAKGSREVGGDTTVWLLFGPDADRKDKEAD